MVASKLGLPHTGLDKASVLRDLETALISRFEVGQRCLLLVDEAQNLSVEALEELRMLSNLQFQSNPLIQSFLLGQPQLRRNLGRSDMAQLTQRIIASYHLGAMTELETAEYVLHRLQLADWKRDPLFEQSALSEIHRYSGGIPRRINTVCTRLLIHGFLEKLHTLDASSVHTVVEELNAELSQVIETEGSAQPIRPVRSHPSSTHATPPLRDTNPNQLKGASLATPDDKNPRDKAINTFETRVQHDDALVEQLRSFVRDYLKRKSPNQPKS